MTRYGSLLSPLLLIAFFLATGCNSKKTATKDQGRPASTEKTAADQPATSEQPDAPGIIFKHELIGTYKAEIVYPFDTTFKTPVNAEITKGWTLKLMEKDNFEFTGNNGKSAIGYWAFREKDGIQNILLFQSGHFPENIIYARFSRTELLFESPLWILDSAFRGVLFKRVEK